MKDQNVNFIADGAGFRIIFGPMSKGLPKMQPYQAH